MYEIMRNLLRRISKNRFPYDPLITVSILSANLLHNLHQFQSLTTHKSIAPVLKSNAYGHGLFEVSEILEKESRSNPIPFFVVDSYFEAVALRSHGIKTKLLIIGYSRPETILACKLKDVSFTVTSLETLRSIAEAKRRICLHLKIDTGMRRQGILPKETRDAIRLIISNPALLLEGITSHLSDSDNSDHKFTLDQISLWNGLVAEFRHSFSSIKFIHLSATYGHKFANKIDSNVSRLGIGLYGLGEVKGLPDKIHLLPVMEITTIITSIKKLRKNETVGYGNTFRADDNMMIATIPVGYYEALDRRLSNNGFVLVGSERIPSPIIGRISMNITTIDVSHIPDVTIGAPVTVISNKKSDPNSISSITDSISDIIPYEIAVKIPSNLKRVVV